MADNVAFGKDSIQLPYRRFLADSAAGLVAVGMMVLAYYAFGSQRLGAPTEVKVFLLVILFLLATPIGFAANAISWIVFGNGVALVERICFAQTNASSRLFVTYHIALSRQMQMLTYRFMLTVDNFRETGSFFRDLMESDILARVAPPSNARELMIFLRSMALFTFIAMMIALAVTQVPQRHELTIMIGLASCIILSLRTTSEWRKLSGIRLLVTIGLVCAGVAGPVFLIWNSSQPLLPICLLVVALLSVIIAGVVDYYHYSYVLLHAYFALEALGIAIDRSGDRSTELMKAASALFGEAMKIARGESAA